MPAPRWMARFNRRVTNRLTGRLAPYLPGFGVVVHTGRRSGHQYRTPVNVFAQKTGFVIALTYGADSQWVRNVVASGGCTLETRGRVWPLTNPRLIHDARHTAMPPLIGLVLRVMQVDDFLELSFYDEPRSSPGRGSLLGERPATPDEPTRADR
jgi:deazaflavin-dependent oxidoreductase (nitroreductase family)